MRLVATCFVFLLAAGPAAQGAEPIVGDWLTGNGETVRIAACGQACCSTVLTGAYAGQTISQMTGQGLAYSGTILDPQTGKTYKGSMTVEGSRLNLKGCLMEIFCKSVQNWTRK